MRLWHYKLIPVLPDKMLVAQWRECIAIKRQWEKGTLKNRLVSYVMKNNKNCFRHYVIQVADELYRRNINHNLTILMEIGEFCEDAVPLFPGLSNENYSEHNDRYLKQCYYNLQEKYDRGIITEEEWQKIFEICINIITERNYK